jgi:type I restriction enzyme M protein
MPIKKSELYSSIWKSCDELRGGMDASQYKDYVLVLLFVKYVSDRAESDKSFLIEIPEGASFRDLIALDGKTDIGDKMNKVIAKLADAADLRGVLDVADWNDGDKLGKDKDKVDRLSKLIRIFQRLDFRANRPGGDDLLGDAYEYLMRHFATESGKSKGQFYTPAEVSRVMADLLDLQRATRAEQSIYDPTCGSGSLLIKVFEKARERSHELTKQRLELSVYGQEKDNATFALAKMNMVLHGILTAELHKGDTLSDPCIFNEPDPLKLKKYDFIVANPPFSTKSWSSGVDLTRYGRFAYGTPPEKNGDYAFLLHILTSLKPTGRAVVVLPHGVLFRGGKEGEIRRKLVEDGHILAIIGLPANLFYGTGIPACLIVLDKEHAASRDAIFMIDASRDYKKDGNKNRLREQDLHKIVDTFSTSRDLPGYSRRVPISEIKDPKNAYNLNIPRYIDASDAEDRHDLTAHMLGGIPARDLDALAPFWRVFPDLRATLFHPTARPGYFDATPLAKPLRQTIAAHPQFLAWRTQAQARFTTWRAQAEAELLNFKTNANPRPVVDRLGESMLAAFADDPLLNPYDMYQRLRDYWDDTMQDDLYAIAEVGWRDAAKLSPIEKGSKDAVALTVKKIKYRADLLPPALLTAYDKNLARIQAELDAHEAARAAADQAAADLLDEHSGEDGLLADLLNDKGKLPAAALKQRLKELERDRSDDAQAELTVLRDYKKLIDEEAAAADKVNDRQDTLDVQLHARYTALTEDDVKAIAIRLKWLDTLQAALQAEIDQIAQDLTAKLDTLTQRYADTLPALEAQVAALSSTVLQHLARMGVAS